MSALRIHAIPALLLAVAAAAQEQLRVQGPVPATVVLGSAARVELVIEGEQAAAEAPQVPNVPGLQVRVSGPSRQMFSSFGGGSIVRQVTTTWQLLLQPLQEGKFTIPEFSWQTGTRVQKVGPIAIEAVKELRGAEFAYLDVALEKTRVYVHEPIRARVTFGIDKSLRLVQGRANNGQVYLDVEVQAPWLSGVVGAESLPDAEENGERAPIVLNQMLQLAAYDGAQQRGQRTYQGFLFAKSFLPTRPGRLTLDAPMLRYDVQVREGRVGLFGERVGGQTQNYYVYGKPLEVEVLPIPEQGRPSPYYGAVGRFAIDAAADRDRVKVGNSVKVTLTIRGSGNLEFLRVPELDGWDASGLHKLGQSKARKDDAVLVTYDFTPLSEQVKEIPPIEWNWFDTTPGVETFVRAATRALPLTVQPLAEGETLAPLAGAARKPVVAGVDDIFDLPDLGGAPVLRATAPGIWSWLALLGPWLLVGAFVAASAGVRRRNRDPLAVRARGAARACERALADGVEPMNAFAEYLGAKLRVPAAAVIGEGLAARLVAAGMQSDVAQAAQDAIERGTAARYGGGGGLDVAAVRALVERCEGAGERPRSGALALLLAALLSGAALRAQAGEDAVAAYRKGDYAAAERAFAERFERTGDRRLLFARGNCWFRLGDLPRAIQAWECARLGLPRDAELLANLRLARQRLEFGGDGSQPFEQALVQLRERCTDRELALLLGLSMAFAAAALGLGGRRPFWRWLGIAAFVPGVLIGIELLWLAPARPPAAIALGKLELSSEPRTGLPAVATVAAGMRVSLRSSGSGEFVRVEAQGHSGYAPRRLVGPIE